MAGSSKLEALRGAQDSHGTAWATHIHPRSHALAGAAGGSTHLRGAQDSHGTAWATHAHAPRTPFLTRTTA